MRYAYPFTMEPQPEGGFTVEVPALPGCFSEGDTITEALRNAEEAISCHLGSIIKHGEEVPRETGTVPLDTEDLTEGLLFRVAVILEEALAA